MCNHFTGVAADNVDDGDTVLLHSGMLIVTGIKGIYWQALLCFISGDTSAAVRFTLHQ